MSDDKFKKFHFMIVGKIIFEVADTDGFQESTVNAIITNKENKIPAQMLGKAQQACQANLQLKLADTSFRPLDVVILNVVPLGNMTDAEFAKTPEGTIKAEIVDEPVIDQKIPVRTPSASNPFEGI